MFKIVSNNIPLFTIVMMFWGYCRQVGYYSPLGINIYTYLAPQEILMSFFPSLLTFLWLLLLATIYIIFSRIEKVTANNSTGNNSATQKDWVTIITIVALVGIVKLTSYLDQDIIYNWAAKSVYWSLVGWYSPHFWGLITIIIISFSLVYNAVKTEHIVNNMYYILLALTLSIGLIINIHNGVKSNIAVLHPNRYTKISFKYYDRIISSNRKRIFIGETQNFIFLCAVDSLKPYVRTTEIYKRENIDSLQIRYEVPNATDSTDNRPRRRPNSL